MSDVRIAPWRSRGKAVPGGVRSVEAAIRRRRVEDAVVRLVPLLEKLIAGVDRLEIALAELPQTGGRAA